MHAERRRGSSGDISQLPEKVIISLSIQWNPIQWNPSIKATIGEGYFGLYREVSSLVPRPGYEAKRCPNLRGRFVL